MIAAAIVIPLFGAIACVLARGPARTPIALAFTLASVVAVALIATHVMWTREVLVMDLGGWAPPVGIRLRAHGMAAGMLLLFAVVGPLVTLQWLVTARESARSSAWPLWFFSWAALNALALSGDVFNLYVTLELVVLSAVALLAANDDRSALAAALRYLFIALPGSLSYLLGVALLYAHYATLDLSLLGVVVRMDLVTSAALVLMSLGLALKSGLFPLHAWLPSIYLAGHAPVVGLLSGLYGKAPFFVLFMIWTQLVPSGSDGPLGGHLGSALGVLGAVGVLWGAVLALGQRELRPVIAYSSVSQSAYLFLFFAIETPDAALATLLLAISHGVAAPALFLAAQAIVAATGEAGLRPLEGLAQHMPLPFFALGLAGLSLMGIPPSGGFVGKWLLLRSALDEGRWWIVLVIVSGGLIAAAYVVRVVQRAFASIDAPHPARGRARGSGSAAITLAFVAFLLGIAPEWLLELFAVGLAP